MQYILLQPGLSVDVENHESGLCVEVVEQLAFPVLIEHGNRYAELSKTLAASLPKVDETVLAELMAKREGRPIVVNTAFPPDPWLLAVAYIMWEGIIQGMTWDAVKTFVHDAISKLQSLGVAPSQAGERRSSRGLVFNWSGQLKIANLVELNGKLQAKYSSMSEEKRNDVPRLSKK